jgi:hypothetical protein
MNRSIGRAAGGLCLGLTLFLGGCSNKGPATSEDAGPASGPRKGVLARTIDVGKIKEQLHQIGIAYNSFLAVGRAHGPAKWQDLMEDLGNDASIRKAFSEERFILVPNAAPGGNQLLAYEKEPDDKGIRYVVMADGSVKNMDKSEFEAAKPKGK